MINLYLLLFQYFVHVLTTTECRRNSLCKKDAEAEGQSKRAAIKFCNRCSNSARAEVANVSMVA